MDSVTAPLVNVGLVRSLANSKPFTGLRPALVGQAGSRNSVGIENSGGQPMHPKEELCAGLTCSSNCVRRYQATHLPLLFGDGGERMAWMNPCSTLSLLFLLGAADVMTDTLLLIDDNAVQAATRQDDPETSRVLCDSGRSILRCAGNSFRAAKTLPMSSL